MGSPSWLHLLGRSPNGPSPLSNNAKNKHAILGTLLNFSKLFANCVFGHLHVSGR
jgi:hypothetical protein